MKYTVDKSLCTGHGRCAMVAPDVYELDADGYNAHRGETVEVAPGQDENAKRGARNCPEQAITVTA